MAPFKVIVAGHANLAFIGGKTNRAISDKPPVQYLPPLIEQHGLPTFAAQAIPTDLRLLEMDSYKDFLKERRALIADHLNRFLSGSADAPVKQSADIAV